MTPRRSQPSDAAFAGWMLIGAMVIFAGAGFGVGSLVGLTVPLGLVGLFAGLGVGFLLVYARYRRV